ncbi:MAG TPA: TetR/AcrR family transcriptional regulator [Xanthobacteraceae bacterium]|jgi:AcrR family transcriptional regulator|nr:TetR/AcrR family transcriptional regulator [Xanthobacteraceae bacterium]
MGNFAKAVLNTDKNDKIPPRARLLGAAGELFYRHGIRAVGVEAIAEAAGTNKMTLYRHFASKDELVAEYLRQEAHKADAYWDKLEAAHPGDPLAQIRAWVKAMAAHVANCEERGCALANAAVELPEKGHPARAVIEEFKRRQRAALIRLGQSAGLSEPDMLADELHLMLEGARVTAQSVGADGLGARLMRMSEAVIASHRAS